MKVSYNWLKKYLDFSLSSQEVDDVLTKTGLEVESVLPIGSVEGNLKGIVVGEVLSCIQHPNADRLKITQVTVGNETLQIVCGASNVAQGQKVAVALVGTTLHPNPKESIVIKEAKIRGEASFGMLCAEDELGIGNSHDGILILDNNLQNGTPLSEVIQLTPDFQIEIGLTPNRSDAMGHIGVARDLKAYLNYHGNSKLEIKWPELNTLNTKDQAPVHINISATEACNRYCGAVISNVKIAPSPEWLQTALTSIGLEPINNVVDITNYVMRELGTPLHAFDLNAIGSEVIVRKANPSEQLITLDGVERKLHADDLLIANTNEALCLAGLMGGKASGVSNETHSIFLESANFDAVSIRKMAKRHGLNTDASFRFERGVDPELTYFALNRAIDLIVTITGGTLTGGTIDKIINPIQAAKININLTHINTLIGLELSSIDIETILLALDFKIIGKNQEDWEIVAPSYRTDVTREADVIEEVIRIVGFDAIPIPQKWSFSAAPYDGLSKHQFQSNVSEFFVAKGFSEIMMNSLSKGAYAELNPATATQAVRILNPLSSDLNTMRQNMAFGLLETIAYNQNRQQADMKIFEFGSSYAKIGDQYQQENHLALAISGRKEIESWNNSNDASNFFTLKGAVISLLNRYGIHKTVEDNLSAVSYYSDGLSLSHDGQTLVTIGIVSKSIQKYFDVKNEVYIAIFNWDLLHSLSKKQESVFSELPKTFEVRRDFSLLMEHNITYKQLKDIALKSCDKHLKEVRLFDVYIGEKIGSDKKSYALSFHFQDQEHTLTDQIVDPLMENIRRQFEKQLGVSLR